MKRLATLLAIGMTGLLHGAPLPAPSLFGISKSRAAMSQ